MGCKVSINIQAKGKPPDLESTKNLDFKPDAESSDESYDYELTSPDNVLLDKKGLEVK
jgi:hypothetical protein